MPDRETITDAVKSKYGAIAAGSDRCCNPSDDPCCETPPGIAHGYTTDQLESVPAGAALGLGCGNPSAYAGIHEGDIVVDLGSGAGIDCFLASQQVGERGLVIGIDMTEEMLARAQANAAAGAYTNVEFRQGNIEDIPVKPSSVDVVISNCVINLAADKSRVFREVFRILKPGGRFCVSDMVANGPIPDSLRDDPEQWASCVAGALQRDEYLQTARDVGFDPVEVCLENAYDYARSETFHLSSVTVVGVKPVGANGA